MVLITDGKFHKEFLKSNKRHILMVTNHGIHQWNVLVGLPDTGGQNVFVNQFTDILEKLGFKITIANRGGFKNPATGISHEGFHYRGPNKRILYIQDDKSEFLKKEIMNPQIEMLSENLFEVLNHEGLGLDLIVSHYWDGAKVAALFNRKLKQRVKHVWVPHSIGALKKANVDPSRWAELNIEERIEEEKRLLPELDAVASTSSAIGKSLRDHYGHDPEIFLPPCIDDKAFFPRDIPESDPAWDFLTKGFNLSIAEIKKRRIIIEVSRTASSKRKDVLIKAFAKVRKKYPDILLAVSMDQSKDLAINLKKIMSDEGFLENTFLIGRDWDTLPASYAIADIYCSPSIVEGFGMAVQEGAASGLPVVGCKLIPFVSEYLLGDQSKVKEISYDGMKGPLKQGEAAIMVEPDDIAGFAKALEILLEDDVLRQKMGKRAHQITIPYFTWRSMTLKFLKSLDIEVDEEERRKVSGI